MVGLFCRRIQRKTTLSWNEVFESTSDDELPTAYSSGEYVPGGTKHLVRVQAITDVDVGEYEIYVVMASGY